MAARSNITRADERANEIAETAQQKATTLMNVIDRLAWHIATLMEEAHGGKFRVQIEHDCGLIAIAKCLDPRREPIDPISLREAI